MNGPIRNESEKLGLRSDRLEFCLIIAGVMVVGGLVLEYWRDIATAFKTRPRPSAATIGGVLVTAGVFLEVVLGIFIAKTAKALERIANMGIAEANLRAAEANRKAEEEKLARVKLEQQTAIRDLTEEETMALTKNLSTFSGQHAVVDVFPALFESAAITRQLIGVLVNAGWTISGPNFLTAPPNVLFSNNPRAHAGPLLIMGILVRATEDARSQAAAKALFEGMLLPATAGMHIAGAIPNPEDP